MTVAQLDFIFPFIVFAYGALLTFVLFHKGLMKIAHERFPAHVVKQMETNRYLAIFCLFFGALWSLQNLWL